MTLTPSELIAHALDTLTLLDPSGTRRAYRDYLRGGLPTDSMPDFVTRGANDSPMLGFDRDDQHFAQRMHAFEAALSDCAKAADAALKIQGYFLNTAKALENPPPRPCINPNCAHVHSMIGGDKPQDSAGRCNTCRVYFSRNQRERPMKPSAHV